MYIYVHYKDLYGHYTTAVLQVYIHRGISHKIAKVTHIDLFIVKKAMTPDPHTDAEVQWKSSECIRNCELNDYILFRGSLKGRLQLERLQQQFGPKGNIYSSYSSL